MRKRIKGIISIVVLLLAHNARSQDCTGMQFPYLFSPNITGGTTYKCTSSPNSVTDGVPYHLANGTIIDFCVDPGIEQATASACIDQFGIEDCVKAAIDTWSSICPGLFVFGIDDTPHDGKSCPSGDYVISGGSENSDFPVGTDADGAYGKTYRVQTNGIIDPSSCYTKLNFTGQLESEKAQTLVNCPVSPYCDLGGYMPVNACYTILHEIGHLFGLQDLKNYGCGGSCKNANTVMYGDLPKTADDCYSHGLTTCDICYFKFLYCPASADVKQETTPGQVTLILGPCIPSPFGNRAQVQLSLSRPSYIRATLFDVLGHFVATVYNGFEQEGKNIIDVDASKLPAGTYLLRVVAGDSVSTIRIAKEGN